MAGLFSGIFKRASHPGNPSNDLLYMFSQGRRSHTGVSITEESALSSTAVLAAVRGVAEIIASMPLFLYERKDRGKEKAKGHPLFNVMHIKPNEYMTSMTFREVIAGHALLWGTAYAEKIENGRGNVAALYPLLPSNMETKWLGGELIYAYKLPDGQTKIFSKEKILRVPGFSTSGICGYSPVKLGMEAIGLTLALEEFGARFFGNGAAPNSVLEHPGQMGDAAYAHLKESWEARHQGLSNSHRVAILEEGMHLKEFGVSPEQAQAIESRKFQVAEIARLFNVPLHMLKELDRTGLSNVETLSREYIVYSLMPWLVRFEQAFSTQLLTDKELKTLFFEHVLSGLLRGNTEARHQSYVHGRNWGYYSVNDIREFENLNPVENGDVYLQPLNMQEAGKEPELFLPLPKSSKSSDIAPESRILKTPKGGPIGRQRIARAYKRLFLAASQKVVNYETLNLRKAVKKMLQRDVSGFEAYLQDFYEKLPVVIRRDIGSVILSYAEQINDFASGEVDLDPEKNENFKAFIENYLLGFERQYVDSSRGQLQELIDKTTEFSELPEVLEGRLDEWQEKRADKITTQQLSSLSNGVAMAAFFAAGVYAVWHVHGDTCPFCRALEGRRIKTGEVFVENPGEFQPPGADGPLNVRGKVLYPPLHGGCDCYLSPG